MSEAKTIGFILVETPLHCGAGQDIGIVDQPIQRERHTNYPIIQASEIKGALRDYYKRYGGQYVDEIFGPEETTDTGGAYASCVSFGDARILFFPVKSFKDVYVWVTCKDVLERFLRTLKLINVDINFNINGIASISDKEIVVFSNQLVVGNKVILEDQIFNLKQIANQNIISGLIDMIISAQNNSPYSYLNQEIKDKLCIVSDEIFRNFVEMSTEVITRIKINRDTGVVETPALWTEEYLPTDTILYFPIIVSDPKIEIKENNQNLDASRVLNKIKEKFSNQNSYIQIGGNETIGKGFVKINIFLQEDR